MRSYAVIPPLLLDQRQRRLVFHNENGICTDMEGAFKERQNLNMWTTGEKEIFREKFLQHPKNFGAIAASLDRKNAQDCVRYYYLSKKQENYKQLLRKSRQRTRSSRNPQKSNQNTSLSIADALTTGVTTRLQREQQQKTGQKERVAASSATSTTTSSTTTTSNSTQSNGSTFASVTIVTSSSNGLSLLENKKESEDPLKLSPTSSSAPTPNGASLETSFLPNSILSNAVPAKVSAASTVSPVGSLNNAISVPPNGIKSEVVKVDVEVKKELKSILEVGGDADNDIAASIIIKDEHNKDEVAVNVVIGKSLQDVTSGER